jgi:hypothetical protein
VKKFILGDFIEFDEEDILARFRVLQKIIAKKVSEQKLLDTAYTKLEVDDKDEAIYYDGTLYTDTKSGEAEQNAKEYADNLPVTDSKFPDTIPSVPTNFTADGLFKIIQLKWDYDSSSYIAAYEVFGSQIIGFTPDSTNLLSRSKTSSFVHDVGTNQQWYYRIRAINTHGTPSAYTEEFTATTVKVVNDDIQDETITNNLIAANAAIDFAKIANVEIIDSMIANATITNAKIADATIESAKIKELHGEKIIAGTISTQQMIVGSFDNLIQDPLFETNFHEKGFTNSGGSWSIFASSVVRSGTNVLRYDATGQTANANVRLAGSIWSSSKGHVPASEGDSFYAETWVRANGVSGSDFNGSRIFIQFRDKDGVTLESHSGNTVIPTTQWLKSSNTATAPSGTAYVIFFVQVMNDGYSSQVYFDSIYARRMFDGNLLVNGSVKADHIESLNGLDVGNGQFVVDSSGNVTFAGELNGVTGTFSGDISSPTLHIKGRDSEGHNGIRLESGLVEFGGGFNYTGYSTINAGTEDLEFIYRNYDGTYKNLSMFDIRSDWSIFRGDVDVEGITQISNTGAGSGSREKALLTLENYQPSIDFHDISTNQNGKPIRIENDANSLEFNLLDSSYNITQELFRIGTSGVSIHNGIITTSIVEAPNHAFLKLGNIAIKGLNGSTHQAQFRNTADSGYIEAVASAFTTSSRREWKKNITDYAQSALDKIVTTPVHEYHMLTDKDTELKRVGLIYDEIPWELASISGEGVDLYAMCSVLWKAVQELNEKLEMGVE